MGKERWIGAAETVEPISRAFGLVAHPLEFAAYPPAAACASPPPTASVSLPLIPAGEARVWFYRPVDAYDSLNTPGALTPRGDARSFPRDIRMNDAIVGISPPNGASYRDVPAG